MFRCVAFLTAATILSGLSARADYIYVRIDLSQVYQNIPSMGAIAGVGGQPNPMGAPDPNPIANPMIGGGPLMAPGTELEGPYIQACIEIKSKLRFEGKKEAGGVNTGGYVFDHPWGRGARFVTTPQLTSNMLKYVVLNRPPLSKEFEKSFRKELTGSRDARKYLTAATWAFQRGLTKEFHATMDDLRKLEPKHPVVVNYTRVQNALKKAPTADDPAIQGLIADLKAEKYHAVGGDSGFYIGLTNLQNSFDGGVKRRVNRLSEVMENFYYWFALQDQLAQPPLPKYRQLLVVSNTIDEFYAKHSQWGAQPFEQDGVTPRRDNFILMSWRPLDDIYKTFDANNQDLWKKLQVSKDWFVSGVIWDPGRVTQRDIFQMAFTQTMTVVQKALEDESELATLTLQGTRQLLYASGVLPRQVHTPEWIAHGFASFFQTPPGSLYQGVGLPSWSNLITLKHLRMQKKLDRPADVLKNLYTDRYFRSAQKYFGELADVPDKEKLNEHIREEMELASSTAWAFVYYLIERRRQPQLLLRYCQELNSLPRDLDLDERALEACFAKVFDVADPSNPARVDPTKLAALADAWFSEMSGVSLDSPELQNEYLEVRKKNSKRAEALLE